MMQVRQRSIFLRDESGVSSSIEPGGLPLSERPHVEADLKMLCFMKADRCVLA